MHVMPLTAQITPSIKRKQDICGWLCILAYVCLVGYHAGRFFGLFDATISFMVPRSVFAVAALIMFYRLASNLAAEIFAMAQCAIELFFSIAMPLLAHGKLEQIDKWIFVTNAAFCLLSLYLWIILLNNNKFRHKDIWWIMLMPLIQGVDICIYTTYVTHINSVAGLTDADPIVLPTALRLAKMAVAIVAPVGAWKLCHSTAFSGNYNGLSLPSFSVWNRYGLIFGLMVVAAVLLS